MKQENNLEKEKHIWLFCAALVFGCLGAFSLFITDFLVVPRAKDVNILSRLWFFKEPMHLISCTIPPAVASYYASYRWLVKDSKFIKSWFSVAGAAWLSLAANPIIWLLILSSLFVYAIAALAFIFLGGVLLNVAWLLFAIKSG